MRSFIAVGCTLGLLLLFVLSPSTRAVVLVCRSRTEAAELARLAGSEDVTVRAHYELSAPGEGADADDLRVERDTLAATLERFNMIVSVHDAARRPNLVAMILWPSLVSGLDGATGRPVAAPPPHPGTLYYDSDGLPPTHGAAWVANATACGLLFASESARRDAMVATMHELTTERDHFDARAHCTDPNMRLVHDPHMKKLRCQCPPDKTCGNAGERHNTLFIIMAVLFFVLVIIAIVAMLYSAATQLDRRQTLANEVARKQS